MRSGGASTERKIDDDKDGVTGAAKNVGGKIKETIARATGDRSMQAEGKKGQAAGEVQETYGRAKDKTRK